MNFLENLCAFLFKNYKPPTELPELTGDEWQDAWNEYQLLKNPNATGQREARLRFKNVQRYLHGKLNPKELEM